MPPTRRRHALPHNENELGMRHDQHQAGIRSKPIAPSRESGHSSPWDPFVPGKPGMAPALAWQLRQI